MKKINLLIITTLSIFLYNCSETKDLFSIATKDLKQVYKSNESVNLSIENAGNVKIDSVIYFSNDIQLGTSKNNTVFKFISNFIVSWKKQFFFKWISTAAALEI
jgi:hypothetical protein